MNLPIYERYPWHNVRDFGSLSDETLKAWEAEGREVERRNDAKHAERCATMKRIRDDLRSLGADQKVIRYVDQRVSPGRPVSFEMAWSSVRNAIEKAKDAVRQKTKDAEDQAARERLRAEAILWLMEKGKVLGEDFMASDAIEIANELAYDEETARRVKELPEGSWFDFEENNCDGPCEGWDGVSRRCQCGNRRVGWTTHDFHSFKEPSIYGEAY